MSTPTTADGARALGIEEREVESVDDSPAGLVVRTTDGQAYVVVPEDRPDGLGRSGLMYLLPPNPRYRGTFPVYAQPKAADDVEGSAPAGDAGDSPAAPTGPPTGSAREVLAWVGNDPARARAALDVENAHGQRKSLMAALERLVSA